MGCQKLLQPHHTSWIASLDESIPEYVSGSSSCKAGEYEAK
jgi:hypothetical protein